MPPCFELPFFVNPSVGADTLGAALLQQDSHSSRMKPVYFASRVLKEVEKTYTGVEQIMLALMFAVRKFRSYLLHRPFVILTVEHLFPWVSTQMSLSSRISKWMVELQEYDYTFKVEDSVRAQLANLLTYRVHEKRIAVREVKVMSPPPKVIPNAYTLFFDGAYRRASGKVGGGLVLLNPQGEIKLQDHLVLPKSLSNNEAEYDILILGLRACIARRVTRLMVKGDALLIVKQVLGIWACKNEKLKAKVKEVRTLLHHFEEAQIYHIPRKENHDADDLAQQAVVENMDAPITIAAATLKSPRFEGLEALAPLVNYILEGEFPPDFSKDQRQRLIKKASSFLWLEGVLYQKGKDQVCRRIPTSSEIPCILQGLHEEACGGHFAHDLTTKKILQAGYVWPTLHIDVQYWCKSCHRCQVNGNRRLLHGPRQLVIASGPFEKWGIDAMGPLPRTSNGKVYIIVAVDYMTKWVEAQSVSKVNEKTVSRFVYSHICCRFGAPKEVISDNGPGFRDGLLTEVCEELKIKHKHSTPYYPQSNGAVEKANGIIAGIIQKMVGGKPKHWDKFLDGALWAYRTTYKHATNFTPFHLVYGQEALQPIELEIPTLQARKNEGKKEEDILAEQLLKWVELDNKRELAIECYRRQAERRKEAFDKEVKDKGISKGGLVLQYNSKLDNRYDAKFLPKWEGPYVVSEIFPSGYYQLMDLDGTLHKKKVNGYRLKPYLARQNPDVEVSSNSNQLRKCKMCHRICPITGSSKHHDEVKRPIFQKREVQVPNHENELKQWDGT